MYRWEQTESICSICNSYRILTSKAVISKFSFINCLKECLKKNTLSNAYKAIIVAREFPMTVLKMI